MYLQKEDKRGNLYQLVFLAEPFEGVKAGTPFYANFAVKNPDGSLRLITIADGTRVSALEFPKPSVPFNGFEPYDAEAHRKWEEKLVQDHGVSKGDVILIAPRQGSVSGYGRVLGIKAVKRVNFESPYYQDFFLVVEVFMNDKGKKLADPETVLINDSPFTVVPKTHAAYQVLSS